MNKSHKRVRQAYLKLCDEVEAGIEFPCAEASVSQEFKLDSKEVIRVRDLYDIDH